MSNAAWGEPIEDYSCVTLERGRRQLRDRDRLSVSAADQHLRHALRDPLATHYLVAHDPETIEVVETDGAREIRKMLTTNVPHYRTFVFDAVERVRAGKLPLASLSDYVPVARLVDAAYAKAAALA